jgi:hypothetical protein
MGDREEKKEVGRGRKKKGRKRGRKRGRKERKGK